jgi:hypothetical protein
MGRSHEERQCESLLSIAKVTTCVSCNFARKLIQVSMQEVQDEMRRYDSLGGVMWFRAIEPTIDGEGWMICLGTH